MVRVVKAISVTLLLILVVTFALENTESVVLRYYFGLRTPAVPVFLFALGAVLLGVLLAGIAFIWDLWGLKRALRERDREIAALRDEVKSLRGPENREDFTRA